MEIVAEAGKRGLIMRQRGGAGRSAGERRLTVPRAAVDDARGDVGPDRADRRRVDRGGGGVIDVASGGYLRFERSKRSPRWLRGQARLFLSAQIRFHCQGGHRLSTSARSRPSLSS